MSSNIAVKGARFLLLIPCLFAMLVIWVREARIRTGVLDLEKSEMRKDRMEKLKIKYANDPEWRQRILSRNNVWARKRYHAQPELMKDRQLRQTYGMSLIEFKLILESQDGRCAICRVKLETQAKKHSPTKACVDHHHKSKRNRGILCSECNSALGFFHENPSALLNALIYLAKWSNKT